MAVLGIHDAYDAGAALVSNGRVVSAVNEERFTKLKNDVGFPAHSVRYLLKQLEGEEIKQVAIPWIGGSALFARVFPSLEVKRRRLWRREDPKPHKINMILKNFVFRILQNQNPKWIWKMAGKSIGSYQLGKKLDSLGVNKKIVFIDHHTSHAATAYYASGFKEALVITLDGAGDGLSGSVSVGDNGELRRINEFKASASLGLLYGAATIACNLRFSEDEGKLMSLAAYSYPTEIKELDEISHYDEDKRQLVSNAASKFEFLLAEYMKDNLLWKYEREAFAFAIQKHVEKQVIKIVKQYIEETKIHNIAVSGGSFSNIITNMLINELPEVKDFFVFPHMGDGGLALGAAYYFDFQENGKFANKQIDNIYYGPEYSNNEIEEVLKKYTKERRISYDEVKDIASYTAEKIAKENKIVLWFQGRMEYGPRALGNRSVLALANDPENRNHLNLIIKRRPYYQPFASTILEEDAAKILTPYPRVNRFMTVGYGVKPKYRGELVAASHIDGTTRPQTLGRENKLYRELLQRIKREIGYGAVLNTSFNKHRRPIVMNPEDAIWTLLNSGAEYLAIGDFFVEKK